jgi:DnaK suppressor protein
MQDYDEVRKQLIHMLEDLDVRLDKITEEIKHTDGPISQDFAEQAVEIENNEVLDAIGNSTRDKIENIKQAIIRMDRGEYGFCKVCGEPISAARLVVVPFASMCVKCAALAEGC